MIKDSRLQRRVLMKLFLSQILLIFFPLNLVAVDIGSDTAPTRFNTTVTINDGDRIAGFAALYEGFEFLDAAVTATFDSFFPVYGTISLTGGTLVLNKDLFLRNILDFGFLGNIIGNNHVLQFPPTDKIPTLCGAEFNCSPFFVNQISIGAADAETLSWDFNETHLATASDDGLVRVYNYDGSSLTFAADIGTGGVAIDGVGQVAFRPSERILAFAREGGGATASVYTFTFDVDANTLSTISSTALTADGRACAWHPSGDYLAVGDLVSGGQVIIYPVDIDGNLDVGGAVTINTTNNVYYECLAWNVAGDYLAVGLVTGGGNPELLIIEVDISPLAIVGINASTTIGRSIGGLDWGKGDDFLAVGLQGTVGDNIQIYEHDDGGGGVGNGSLTLLDSTDDIGRTTEGISWAGNLPCFSASSDELGGNAFFNTYSFTDNTLTRISNIEFTGLGAGDDFEATRWGPLGTSAAVSGDDNIIRVYGLPSEACFDFSNLTLINTSNTFFHDLCITFSGNNIWDGQGNTIEFDTTCTLMVDSNSSLMFKDMTLLGVGNNNISALDSSSTISFNNTDIVLKADYTVSAGRLDFLNSVEVFGEDKQFIFQSPTTAHITENAQLLFNANTTFRYEPSSNDRTLLALDDATSILFLNNATLSTSSVGLQLTTGQLFFDNKNFLINEGSSDATSIEFGNGTPVNNLCVELFPAATIEILEGRIRYNNS